MKKILLLLFCSTSAMASFSGYTYRRALIIDHTKVGTATLTYSDFPVLFQSSDVTLSTSSSGGHLSTGYDLVFSTNSDCSYTLNWDTETVNNTGFAQANIWVRIPSVSSSTDTTFYMCYGNSSITTYQGLSSATWDSGYIGVYHLYTSSGSPIVVGSNSVQASSKTFNGDVRSVTVSSGQIDGAGLFDGTTSYIQTAPTVLTTWNHAATLSAWINPSSITGGYNAIVLIGQLATLNGMGLYSNIGSNGALSVEFEGGNGNRTAGGLLSPGVPAYVVATIQPPGTINTSAFVYLNGKSQNFSTTSSNTESIINSAMFIGSEGSIGGFFPGMIDEVRISNATRSPGWIMTEYNNQSSPSTFMTIGAEAGGPVVLTPTTIMGGVKLRGNVKVL